MKNFTQAMWAVGCAAEYERREDESGSLGTIKAGNYVGWEHDERSLRLWCNRVYRFASQVSK